MKVIVSHDIDHLTVSEHFRDRIIPKFLIRTHIELLNGKISFKEYISRFSDFFRNKWQNLEEVMNFDREMGIPSTFFAGMANGLGLSYSREAIRPWLERIIENGFDVGVHGIAYSNLHDIILERDAFREMTGLENFGIRMHYLRNDDSTIRLIRQAGYLFDSGKYELESPYKTDGLWQFPVHIMDTYQFHSGRPWQNVSLENAKKATETRLKQLYIANGKYLTVLMHDHYFSDGYNSWKNWYCWLISKLKSEGHTFTDFKTAIAEPDKSLEHQGPGNGGNRGGEI